jgi:hypothetical protein
VVAETRVRPSLVAEHAELVVVAGEFKGTTVRLSAGTVVIGRGSDCDLVLRTGSGVSRRHCKVQYLGNRFVVVDLESRNGTIVNGQSVERKVLEPGDRIAVGDETIEFIVRTPLAAPPATSATAHAPTATFVHTAVTVQNGDGGQDKEIADDDDPPPPTLPPQSAANAGGAGRPARLRDSGVFSAVPDVPSLPPRASSQKFAGTGNVVSPSPPLASSPSPPRRLAPVFFGVVVVVSLAVVGLFAWDALEPAAPTDRVADAVAATVDAGPVAATVDAGMVAATVDAGMVAAVVDVGVVAAVVDAGAGAVDAGAVGVVVDAGVVGVVVDGGAVESAAAPALVAVRARGTGVAQKVLVTPGERVEVGAALVVVEVASGSSRKLVALRREEAEFAAASDPRARAELEAVRAEIRRLESRATGTQTMTSDKAGTVVDVLVKPGDVVRDATPIVRLQP